MCSDSPLIVPASRRNNTNRSASPTPARPLAMNRFREAYGVPVAGVKGLSLGLALGLALRLALGGRRVGGPRTTGSPNSRHGMRPDSGSHLKPSSRVGAANVDFLPPRRASRLKALD